MRRSYVFLAVLGVGWTAGAVAQGTKVWTVDRYDAMDRGTSEGVEVRSDGELRAGPTMDAVYSAEAPLVWAVAAAGGGVSYVGVGGATAGSAGVVRVEADGRATKVWTGKELAVQAMRVGADGAVYAATSPDGRVYRMDGRGGAATVVFDPAETAERPKYLWALAMGTRGELYVGAGAPAAVYRVPAGGGKAELLFRTADQHIRSLLLAPDGQMWAGSDGDGVIYRYATTEAGARPFAAFAATKREITSLAMDPDGVLYAAGVGNKGAVAAPGLPPLPVTGAVGVTVTFVQPGSAGAAGSGTLVPDGSEVYRIRKDGTPERIAAFRDDVVYGLAFRGGRLLAVTGNRGRVYAIDPAVAGQSADVARVGATQATAVAEAAGGLLIGTSNSGKVYAMRDAATPKATYTSEVFDAGAFARWGRVEERGRGVRMELRTGNVPSPVEGWSGWAEVGADGTAKGVAPGRYAQWRARFADAGGRLDAVAVNYLQRNLRPVVDDVVVAEGARVTAGAGAATGQPATVQVVFPAAAGGVAQAIALAQDAGTQTPLTAQKERGAVTVRWAAHDDNGDDLMFRVWYRGVGETVWRSLKDRISERFLSFDATTLPDGRYELKVEASDAPDHVDADTLTGERVSESFVVDTTPPVVTVAAGAAVRDGVLRAEFRARDETSAVAHAEWSVDGGAWQYMEPVGGLSDGREERYVVSAPVTGGGEHVVAVRVYDRAENVASAKTVVR